MKQLRMLRRLVLLHVWSGLIAWRWLLLVPAFGLGAVAVRDILESSVNEGGVPWRGDMWDLFPALLSHRFLLHFLIGFGFLLLVGDTHLHEQESGTAALAVMRMRSRSLYWIGKMGALGVMASAFVGLGLAIVWVAGLIVAPPSAGWSTVPRDSIGMASRLGISVPVYNILLAGYTAWALWVLGCGTVLFSLFVRHRGATLVAVAVWTLASADQDAGGGAGVGRLWSMGYFLGHHKHRGGSPMPVGLFLAITVVLLVLVALIGSWKIRREEL